MTWRCVNCESESVIGRGSWRHEEIREMTHTCDLSDYLSQSVVIHNVKIKSILRFSCVPRGVSALLFEKLLNYHSFYSIKIHSVSSSQIRIKKPLPPRLFLCIGFIQLDINKVRDINLTLMCV